MAPKSTQLQIRVAPGQKAALRRRAREAGLDLSSYVLSRALPRADSRLAPILKTLRGLEYRFALAELNDLLESLAPFEFGSVLESMDVSGLSPLLRNYVAAMVEQAADRKDVNPPDWTREVVPLQEPWFATDLRGLRPYLLTASPAVFKRRNLFVDAAVGSRV
jgi:hypothetical protein